MTCFINIKRYNGLMGDSAFVGGGPILIVFVVLGIFLLLPVLAAFIILLVQCIKHKWTRRLLIPFIIVAAILGTMMISGLLRLLI